MSDEEKHFKKILDDFDDAMLTTIGSDGRPRSRPMRVAKVTDESDLWFATSKNSGKVDEIRSNDIVAITMQGGGKYLSLTGKAELVDDQATIEAMWSDAWKIWFPEGKTDPSITLLKVTAEDAAYWDLSGVNRLRYLYEAGKAFFTGEKMDVDAIEMDGKVKLQGD